MNIRRIKKAIQRIRKLPGGRYFFMYLANKVLHYYLKFTGSTRVAYPSTVMLELTNHCNLHCTTCPREYDYGKEMNKGFMDIEKARKIIDELWPYLDSIGLTGMGETFMYKEIEEIVDYIKSKNKGIIISVSTNAVLPGFMDAVRPLVNKIDTIQVSIDGLDDVYESIRLHASFDFLDNNLRELSDMCNESKTDLMLNMVVTRENYHLMPAMVDYASQRAINYLDFSTFNLASVTNIDISYYSFYQSEEFLNAVSRLDEISKKHPEVYICKHNFNPGKGFRSCPFPWSHFYISWDTYVPPCCAKPFPKELNFGNVSQAKLTDILNSKSFRDFRRLWYNNETPAFCEKCNFIGMSDKASGQI